MTKAQRKVYGLLESYFFYCESNGYTDFEVWCKDNLDTILEQAIVDTIHKAVNLIADNLF